MTSGFMQYEVFVLLISPHLVRPHISRPQPRPANWVVRRKATLFAVAATNHGALGSVEMRSDRRGKVR